MDRQSIEEAKKSFPAMRKRFTEHIRRDRNISGIRELLSDKWLSYEDDYRGIDIIPRDPDKVEKINKVMDYDTLLYVLEQGEVKFIANETSLTGAFIMTDNRKLPVIRLTYDRDTKKWQVGEIYAVDLGEPKPQ